MHRICALLLVESMYGCWWSFNQPTNPPWLHQGRSPKEWPFGRMGDGKGQRSADVHEKGTCFVGSLEITGKYIWHIYDKYGMTHDHSKPGLDLNFAFKLSNWTPATLWGSEDWQHWQPRKHSGPFFLDEWRRKGSHCTIVTFASHLIITRLNCSGRSVWIHVHVSLKRRCDDSPLARNNTLKKKGAKSTCVSLCQSLPQSYRHRYAEVTLKSSFSLLLHIRHGLGRREGNAEHNSKEDDTSTREAKQQVEDVPGKASNAESTQCLLGEETINQGAHIFIAGGSCQGRLWEGKCQPNAQSKGQGHHRWRRLHVGCCLFDWGRNRRANTTAGSFMLSEDSWNEALHWWQSKHHQAASNHLGCECHFADSNVKGS